MGAEAQKEQIASASGVGRELLGVVELKQDASGIEDKELSKAAGEERYS